MVEYVLANDMSVGREVRIKIKEFERVHPSCSVYIGDVRGVWDVWFTYSNGSHQKGNSYISLPGETGQMWRIRWPVGNMDRLVHECITVLEGVILAALKFEGTEEGEQ